MSADSTHRKDEQPADQPFVGPGSLLRRERLAQSLGLEKVANQLHLSTGVLERLEDDDFEKLPGPVFIRGYLRNYARLLGLAEETVMGSFYHLCPEPEQGCLSSKSSSITHEVRSSHGAVKLVTWLIVIGLAVLLFIWWQGRLAWHNGTESVTMPPPAPSTPESERDSFGGGSLDIPATSLSDSASEPILEPFEIEPPASAFENPPQSFEPVQEEVGTTPPQTGPDAEMTEVWLENMPAPVDTLQAEPEAASAQAEQPVPAAVTGQLVFEFSGPCWVEVRDANDKLRIFGEMRAGVRRTIDSNLGPFRMTLGNASVVRLSIDGQVYDLAPHVRGNVARLTLDPANL